MSIGFQNAIEGKIMSDQQQLPESTLQIIGRRGFILARMALWVGVYLLTIAAIALFMDRLTGPEFTNVLPWVGLLSGVGTVGQYAGNVAEKWGGRQTPE